MDDREWTETGNQASADTVTHAQVLQVFDAVKGPAITVTDVARELDCSVEAARQPLRQLHENGVLNRHDAGQRECWWRVSDQPADPAPINPDDPIFTDRPTVSSGKRDLSVCVDAILYENHSSAT